MEPQRRKNEEKRRKEGSGSRHTAATSSMHTLRYDRETEQSSLAPGGVYDKGENEKGGGKVRMRGRVSGSM